MADKRVQILRLNPGSDRWAFVAHGAAYDAKEAATMRDIMEAAGNRVRIIPIPCERARNRSAINGHWD